MFCTSVTKSKQFKEKKKLDRGSHSSVLVSIKSLQTLQATSKEQINIDFVANLVTFHKIYFCEQVICHLLLTFLRRQISPLNVFGNLKIGMFFFEL